LAVAITASLAIFILHVWDKWSGFVLLGYAMFLTGGYMWLPWRGRIGYAISVGALFGTLIPLVVLMARQ
jgi:hypothetical protein